MSESFHNDGPSQQVPPIPPIGFEVLNRQRGSALGQQLGHLLGNDKLYVLRGAGNLTMLGFTLSVVSLSSAVALLAENRTKS